MKSFLFGFTLLFLMPYFTYASDIKNNHYYLLIKDKINVENKEKKWLASILNNFIVSNEQKIKVLGCNFKRVKGDKETIYNQLTKLNIFEDYNEDLKKYDLSLNKFNGLYFIEPSNLSERCMGFNYEIIILLNNNELMIPYNKHLVFYKQLAITDENKINNFKRNENCLETKYFEMESTKVCFYKNMTILDVYEAMSINPTYEFRKKIKQGEDFSDIYEDDYMRVEVEYKWKGKNKLEIVQYFDGGETYYTFVNQEKRTKLITKFSPD
jgi:hypothetical protein